MTRNASGSETASGKEYVSNFSRLRLELYSRWLDSFIRFLSPMTTAFWPAVYQSPDFKQAQAASGNGFDQDGNC